MLSCSSITVSMTAAAASHTVCHHRHFLFSLSKDRTILYHPLCSVLRIIDGSRIFFVMTIKNRKFHCFHLPFVVEADHFQFCHFFDRIFYAFSTVTRIFHAAIWHVVKAKGWHVINKYLSDFELVRHIHSLR